MRKRDEQAGWLLPSKSFDTDINLDKNTFSVLDDSFYFDRHTIVIALKSNNYETNSIETPYVPKPTGLFFHTSLCFLLLVEKTCLDDWMKTHGIQAPSPRLRKWRVVKNFENIHWEEPEKIA